MARVLIVYATRSGETAEIAKLVAEGVRFTVAAHPGLALKTVLGCYRVKAVDEAGRTAAPDGCAPAIELRQPARQSLHVMTFDGSAAAAHETRKSAQRRL